MLNKKKSFVRYISNEIRTPLNVAFIGLQLLSGNMNYDMSQEVVGDSTQACSSAIGILNDLLLYDKVEDGKMTLDREDVYVRSFIVNCISKFQTQVVIDRALLLTYDSIFL